MSKCSRIRRRTSAPSVTSASGSFQNRWIRSAIAQASRSGEQEPKRLAGPQLARRGRELLDVDAQRMDPDLRPGTPELLECRGHRRTQRQDLRHASKQGRIGLSPLVPPPELIDIGAVEA